MAFDVTGLPVGALVVPASTHENRTAELMLEHLAVPGVAGGRTWSWSGPLAKSFENTPTSATGWLPVACIATTLRHLSRAQAPQRALPAAA